MKARNNKTGEIVTNFGFSKEFGTTSYIDSKGVLTFNTSNSGEWTIIDEEENDFDWQSFRAEAAKDILCSMIQGGYAESRIYSHAALAVKYADSLIAKLKENEEK